ncbi:amidohydrolase family protein [Mangrovihabitans endophyticus]|nr:amidohydrolase family protein [Mangrovihabitans endophyticus]
MTRTGLIDVHAHFVTEEYVAAARAAGIDHPDGMPGWPGWSAEAHLALMDRGGIDKAYLSVSSPGVHFGDDLAAAALARAVNDAGAAVRDRHPDRFGHFAALPLPDVEASVAEVADALDVRGSDGVLVESNHRGRYLGDARLDPLWHQLDRRDALVFVHPTSPPYAEAVTGNRPRPMLEFLFDTARAAADLMLAGVLARFPRIRWILTHGGGVLPLLTDRMELFRQVLSAGTPDEATVADQLGRFWFDMAGTPFPRQMPALDAVVGTRQVVYGSDYCWTPPDLVLDQIRSIDTAGPPADGATWRDLTTRNARRLLSGGTA